jgi:hypothetical protein
VLFDLMVVVGRLLWKDNFLRQKLILCMLKKKIKKKFDIVMNAKAKMKDNNKIRKNIWVHCRLINLVVWWRHQMIRF